MGWSISAGTGGQFKLKWGGQFHRIFHVTYENLDQLVGYNLTVGVPLTISRAWQLQTTWIAYHNSYNYTYEGNPIRLNNISARMNASNSLILGKGWTAELSGWISAPAVEGIRRKPWLGSMDIGIQKALGQRIKVKLTGQDLTHTNRFIVRTVAPGYGGRGRLTFDTRTVLLSLAYNFGNQQLRAQRQTQSASDEETRRAN